jgi:hypothetical protein
MAWISIVRSMMTEVYPEVPFFAGQFVFDANGAVNQK